MNTLTTANKTLPIHPSPSLHQTTGQSTQDTALNVSEDANVSKKEFQYDDFGMHLLDSNHRVLPNRHQGNPAVDSSSATRIQECLEVKSEILGREGFFTSPISLYEMVDELGCELSKAQGVSIEDYQFRGSAVRNLLQTYPTQFEDVNKYWNDSLQMQFASVYNDIDVGVFIKGGDANTLNSAKDILLKIIAKRIIGSQTDEEKTRLVKQLFLTKKFILRDSGPDGKSPIEYLTIGFARKNLPPVDFMVIRELARQCLWIQDNLQVSFKWFVAANRNTKVNTDDDKSHQPHFHIVSTSGQDTFQSIVDCIYKIVRLDNNKGLDYLSVFPLLFSAYLKGNRIIECEGNMEMMLFLNFKKVCDSLSEKNDTNSTWLKTILERPEVMDSQSKYIFILAEGLLRAVRSHHQNNPQATTLICLTACRFLIESGYEDDAVLLWKEMNKSNTPEAMEKVGLLTDTKNMLDKDPTLLSIVLSWYDLKAILGLYKDPFGKEEGTTIITRHKTGYSLQLSCSNMHTLLPYAPFISCSNFVRLWQKLQPTQREMIEKLCLDHDSLNIVQTTISQSITLDNHHFDQVLDLPAPIARLICNVYLSQKIMPEFICIEKLWPRMFGLYESQEARLSVLKQLLTIYEKPDEHLFLNSLESIFQENAKSKYDPKEFKKAALFRTQSDKYAVLDNQYWQESRKEIFDKERLSFDFSCLRRVCTYRPDIASTILTVMLEEGLSPKEAEDDFAAIIQSTLKLPDEKRSWSRLKRLLEEMAKANTVHADIQWSDNTKFYEVFNSVEAMCKSCTEKSSSGLPSFLAALFRLVETRPGVLSKDIVEAIWNARVSVERHLAIPYGKAEEWKDIDSGLALLLAAHPDSEHDDMRLTLLLKSNPSKNVTRAVCKAMDLLGQNVFDHVIEYLKKQPGKDSDVQNLINHPNFVSILAGNPQIALDTLRATFESLATLESPDDCLRIISTALILLGAKDVNPQKDYWITKIVDMLKTTLRDNVQLSTVINDNFEAIQKIVLSRNESEAMLYALLQHRLAGSNVEALASDVATKYCHALMKHVSTATNNQVKSNLLRTTMKCMERGILKNANTDLLETLIINALKMGIPVKEIGAKEFVDSCINWLNAGTENFASQLSQVMISLFSQKCFDGCENEYARFLQSLAKRTPVVESDVFSKAIQMIEKRLPAESKALMSLYCKHFCVLVKANVEKIGCTKEMALNLASFYKVTLLFLKNNFNTAFKTVEHPSSSQTSRRKSDVIVIDEDCNSIREALYLCTSILKGSVHKVLPDESLNMLSATNQKLCSTSTEYLLLLCYQRVSWFRNKNTVSEEASYKELLRHLNTTLERLSTLKEVDIYLQTLEEFRQINLEKALREKIRNEVSELLIKSQKNQFVIQRVGKNMPPFLTVPF